MGDPKKEKQQEKVIEEREKESRHLRSRSNPPQNGTQSSRHTPTWRASSGEKAKNTLSSPKVFILHLSFLHYFSLKPRGCVIHPPTFKHPLYRLQQQTKEKMNSLMVWKVRDASHIMYIDLIL